MIRFTITGTKDDIEIMTAAAMVITERDQKVNTLTDIGGNVIVEGLVDPTLHREEAYVRQLSGITYHEWVRLSMALNAYFDEQKREREKGICLARAEDVEKIIHRQFG